MQGTSPCQRKHPTSQRRLHNCSGSTITQGSPGTRHQPPLEGHGGLDAQNRSLFPPRASLATSGLNPQPPDAPPGAAAPAPASPPAPLAVSLPPCAPVSVLVDEPDSDWVVVWPGAVASAAFAAFAPCASVDEP